MARNSNEKLILNGIKVDSENEFFVGKALTTMKLEYAYQYFLGGAGIRGSQIIDFLVYTAPKPTPLFVHGAYWHGGTYAQETALKEADLNARMRGTWADSVIIWEHECETEDTAANAVRQKLGTG
jgi:hypothetical protein